MVGTVVENCKFPCFEDVAMAVDGVAMTGFFGLAAAFVMTTGIDSLGFAIELSATK